MAVAVSRMFLLHFCTVGRSGDASSIFIDSHWKIHMIFSSGCLQLRLISPVSSRVEVLLLVPHSWAIYTKRLVCVISGHVWFQTFALELEDKKNGRGSIRWLEMKGKTKLRQHVSWGAEGQDELWDVMFLACGSEWNYDMFTLTRFLWCLCHIFLNLTGNN